MRKALYTLFILFLFIALPANATRLPGDLKHAILEQFPDSQIRLDGSVLSKTGDLYLPLLPNTSEKKKGKAHIECSYPVNANADAKVLCFSDGWCFLKVLNNGAVQTVIKAKELPDNLRQQILLCKFPEDLIVPEKFALPLYLKPAAANVTVNYETEIKIAPQITSKTRAHNLSNHALSGALFLTSVSTGSIIMIDEKTLKKIIEFPTEGTPCSMAWAAGKLYIADEAKDRILLLDPISRQFLGQINLPAHSGPKGIAALPNENLLYVSESIANQVAVIEIATQKVLLTTKVAPGPGKLAITPNGNYAVILNVPCAKATILSTADQKVLAVVPVGTMPTTVALTSDSNTAYVSNRNSNTVSIIDLNKYQVTGTIQTGLGPTGLALSSDDQKLYVVQARENSIAVFDTKTQQKVQELKIPVEIDFPGSIKLMPDNKHLLITSEASDTIGMIDLDKLEFDQQVSIGSTSHEAIWVPVN